MNKFNLFRFEPNGHVSDHDNIKFCSSIIDFIFRDIAMNYLGRTDLVHVPPQEEMAVSYNAAATVSSTLSAGGGLEMVSEIPSARLAIHTETDMVITNEEWSDDLALASR
ncbi:MAG: hypothetical protein ACKOBP_14300, partial [Planctomycetia bacterium]